MFGFNNTLSIIIEKIKDKIYYILKRWENEN